METVSKRLAYQRAWQAANREKCRAYNKANHAKRTEEQRREIRRRERERYHQNPEACREEVREWRRKNPEKRKAYQDKWTKNNPDRIRAIKQRSYRKHKARHNKTVWRTSLKRLYGIDESVYNAMLIKQGSKCAICRLSSGRRRLDVDHCHATGVVRGLLCHKCNTAIGKFKDDPAILTAAIAYLNGASQCKLNAAS